MDKKTHALPSVINDVATSKFQFYNVSTTVYVCIYTIGVRLLCFAFSSKEISSRVSLIYDSAASIIQTLNKYICLIVNRNSRIFFVKISRPLSSNIINVF